MCGEGHEHDWGSAWLGVRQGGGVHDWGHAWLEGCVWLGACMSGGHVWLGGVYMVEGVHGWACLPPNSVDKWTVRILLECGLGF